MKKLIKKTLIMTMALILIFSMVACSSSKNDDADKKDEITVTEGKKNEEAKKKPIKLRIYAQYADDDTKVPYDYALDALKKEMPHVELELDVQAQDDGQKIKTYAATGNLPDIFQANLDIINTFKTSNNIMVLDEYVEKLGFKEKMHPSAMNTLYTDDGHCYAFPYAGNELVLLYYNKEIFEQNGVEVPKTYDEFLQAVKVFNSKGIIPLALFAKEKWPCVALFDIFATRLEPQGILKLDRGEGKASEESYTVAAQRIVELVKAGLLPKGATNMNYDQAAALFHQGKAAMFINGQWEIEASTEALGDKVDWMYYPAYDQSTYESTKYAFSGGGGPSGYAVSPRSEYKDVAAEVAAFISLKYAECKYTMRGNPIIATKVDAPIVKPYPPMMQKLAQDIPKITSTTAFAWGLGNAKFKAAIEDNAQKLLTGFYSAEDFVKDMNKLLE
ncbi:MAG TPA: extracellular solute-binding protein [Clostridiaceae bacterium]|nr:extracellular solute-binding protein [Clostridiaceae bacterium]